MNIFVTGGTGFIGSNFVYQALQVNHKVFALRRSLRSEPRISMICQPHWINSYDDENLISALKKTDVLVHFSAHAVQNPVDNLSDCMQHNVYQALDLFEKAKDAGVKHYVVAGSCFEYGRSGEFFANIPSDAPLKPVNSYAVSKAFASITLQQWAYKNNLYLDILRVFQVYGMGEASSRFWPSLKRAALSGFDFSMTAGEQIRDFVNVSNVAQTFLGQATAILPKKPEVNVFNIGSGRALSIRSFAEYWWNEFRAPGRLMLGSVPYRKNEIMRFVAGQKRLLMESKHMPALD